MKTLISSGGNDKANTERCLEREMKMVKRTLIAIALVAFLASTAPADIEVYYWGPMSGGELNKESGVKSDGHEKVFWPYEYKELDICAMPLLMEIGMYVDVKDCKDREVILKQVDCAEIDKQAKNFPCYLGCEEITVRANFDVKLGTRITETSDNVLDEKEGFFDGSDVIVGDGSYHSATVCVRAWDTDIYNGSYGEEVQVGTLYVTAKPDV
jgi:hypothetical protein